MKLRMEDLFREQPLRTPPTSSNFDGEVSKYRELDFRAIEKQKRNTVKTDTLTHSIQKHPATFIPQIPRHFIEEYLPKEGQKTVLDIFSGSGTTGVEAVSYGHEYVGIEVNPLSVLVSKVATHPYPKSLFDKALELFTEIDESSNKKEIQFPGRTQKEHWFEEEAVNDLTDIFNKLERFYEKYISQNNIPIEDEILEKVPYSESEIHMHIWEMFVVVFTNVVFEVSNADPGVSKAYKSPKMKEKIEEGIHPPDVVSTFLEEFISVGSKIENLWETTLTKSEEIPKSQIIYDDIRTSSVSDINADLIVSSPPYINAINYYRGSKLRLFWAAPLLERTEMEFDSYSVRKEIIGSESAISKNDMKQDTPYQLSDVWTCNNFTETSLPKLDSQIKKIYDSDKSNSEKLSYLTYTFFSEDMAKSLETAWKNLSDDGLFFFVVGENTVGGEYIETKDYLLDIATNLSCLESVEITSNFTTRGVAFDEITNRELFQTRNHENGVIECEWILAFSR